MADEEINPIPAHATSIRPEAIYKDRRIRRPHSAAPVQLRPWDVSRQTRKLRIKVRSDLAPAALPAQNEHHDARNAQNAQDAHGFVSTNFSTPARTNWAPADTESSERLAGASCSPRLRRNSAAPWDARSAPLALLPPGRVGSRPSRSFPPLQELAGSKMRSTYGTAVVPWSTGCRLVTDLVSWPLAMVVGQWLGSSPASVQGRPASRRHYQHPPANPSTRSGQEP